MGHPCRFPATLLCSARASLPTGASRHPSPPAAPSTAAPRPRSRPVPIPRGPTARPLHQPLPQAEVAACRACPAHGHQPPPRRPPGTSPRPPSPTAAPHDRKDPRRSNAPTALADRRAPSPAHKASTIARSTPPTCHHPLPRRPHAISTAAADPPAPSRTIHADNPWPKMG